MAANFARHYLNDDDPQSSHYVDHIDCSGLPDMPGAFAIDLDFYQLDELDKNKYTYIESSCMSCYKTERFILKRFVSVDQE